MKFRLGGKRELGGAVGFGLIVFLLHLSGLVDFHELDAVDLRFRLRGQRPAHPDIVLITIDDPSLAAFGQWPWPRGVHAALIDIVSRLEPRAIFLDLLFTEGSPDPKEDEKLKASLEKSGKVILPFYYVAGSSLRAHFPIAPLRDRAKQTAYVNINPDPDGRMRRIHAYEESNGERFYHSSVALARAYWGEEPFAALLKRVPLDTSHHFWIHYPGSIRSFRRISFGEVVQMAAMNREEELAGWFKDKTVLVGHTATGTTDIKPTPYSTEESGVVIQASALDTLLNGRFLRTMPEAFHLFLLIFFSVISTVLMHYFPPGRGLLALISIAFLYNLFNFAAFLFAGWILPVFTPLAVMMLSYAVALFIRFFHMRIQREMLERELASAAEIQQKFLPQARPAANGVDLAFECRFTKQVGGDMVDWVDLGEGRIGVCAGDVSGKGMPAAIYMAKALSDFRGLEKKTMTPAGVCQALNAKLVQDSGGMFLTFLYGVIDAGKKTVTYTSAGHEPLIVYRNETKSAAILNHAKGLPLGVFEEAQYETERMALREGDALLFLTDGVRELRDGKRREYGLENLKQALEAAISKSADSRGLIEQLFKVMEAYRGDPAHDDRTLVCVRMS